MQSGFGSLGVKGGPWVSVSVDTLCDLSSMSISALA